MPLLETVGHRLLLQVTAHLRDRLREHVLFGGGVVPLLFVVLLWLLDGDLAFSFFTLIPICVHGGGV